MMFKKSLLSIAVASSMLLTGCLDSGGDTSRNAYPDYNIEDPRSQAREGRVWPVFDPIDGDLPIPNDLIFDQTAKDGTFLVTSAEANPVIDALNQLSGASTVAPIDIKMSGKIDASTVDGRPVVLHEGIPVPNGNQNVFLIELDYASGDPVQGLGAQEPPTALGLVDLATKFAQLQGGDMTVLPDLLDQVENPSYEVSVIQLDGDDYIRINPTKPLNPRKRYVVVVTNGIKDGSGQPLIASEFYENLTKTDAEEAAGADALQTIRRLINGLWEPTAENYFQLTNLGRPAGSPLTADNVVLSYSFTTSGDEKVLEYIANPAEWFNDQITGFLRLEAVKAVVNNQMDLNEDGKVDYSDTSKAADKAVNDFPSAEMLETSLGALFAATPPAGCQGLSGATAIGCVATTLSTAGSTEGGFADLLPKPKARTTTTTSHSVPVTFVSAVTSNFAVDSAGAPLPATHIPLVAQGTIDVPYYLGIPSDNDGSAIQNQSWQANDTLARAINQAFGPLGLSLPQANPSVSKTVNYIFPFPKQTDADPASAKEDLTIPWLAIYPNPGAGYTKPYPTVIYQHGITTDRSAALSVGTILAAQGFAVIAIDQVAHGVAPASEADKLALAETLLAAGKANGLPVDPTDANKQAVVDGLMTAQFVMDMVPTATPATVETVITDIMKDPTHPLFQPVSMLMAFENTVDNAGSTIPGITRTDHERHFGFTAAADGMTPVKMDFDEGVGSSGSLFINLTGFTNSRDKLRQGVVDLLNLRQSLTRIDLDGDTNTQDLSGSDVYFAGHSLGTLSGIPFVTVANAAGMEIKASAFLTPASGVVRMLENSPSFAPRIIGGLAASGVNMGTANYETFLRVMQSAIDSVDPINFADNLSGQAQGDFQTNVANASALILEVAGTADGNGDTLLPSDQTTVIETATVQLTTQFGTPFPDYLAGSEQLSRVLGATSVDNADTPSANILLSRLGYGSHGMFVMPVMTAAEKEGQTAAEIAAEEARRGGAFQEGVTQMATFFMDSPTTGASGQLPTSLGSSGLTGAPGVIVDDASYNAREHKQLNP